jgi:energy-coupling factor transport system substrate-specific component
MATTASRAASASGGLGWRTRDIVVTAIIGVVFGLVFQVWNIIWGPFDAVFVFFPPAKNLLYGVWLIPAVLAPLIVRKPGAALFAELVAAALSAFIGSQFGPDAILSGLVQGGAAELVFLLTRYRSWSLPVLALAAIASSAAAWIHDWIVWFPDVAVDTQLWVGVFMGVSGVVIVAGGSVLLVRSLRQAGALKGFPAG